MCVCVRARARACAELSSERSCGELPAVGGRTHESEAIAGALAASDWRGADQGRHPAVTQGARARGFPDPSKAAEGPDSELPRVEGRLGSPLVFAQDPLQRTLAGMHRARGPSRSAEYFAARAAGGVPGRPDGPGRGHAKSEAVRVTGSSAPGLQGG